MEMNVFALRRYQLMKCFLSMMLTRMKLVISLAVDQIFIIVVEGVPIQFILQVSHRCCGGGPRVSDPTPLLETPSRGSRG